MSRLDDLLGVEAAGELPPDMQRDLDGLRAAGLVPPRLGAPSAPAEPPAPPEGSHVNPSLAGIGSTGPSNMLREPVATAVEVGLPVAGGIGGSVAGPLGAAGGAALGGGLGSVLGDVIRGQPVSGRKALASTVISAIPGGAATKVEGSIVKRVAAHAIEGGVLGGASTEIDSLIQHGENASPEALLKGAAGGALIGGGLGYATRHGGPTPGGAADEVAARTRPAEAQASQLDLPFPQQYELPLGQRRVVLPGETNAAGKGATQMSLFGADDKLLPDVVKVLDQEMTVPVTDSINEDFKGRAAAAVDAFAQQPENIARQRFFKRLNHSIQEGLFDLPGTANMLNKYGYSLKQFMLEEFLPSISASGKRLNRLGQMKKRMLLQMSKDEELRAAIDAHAIATGEDSPFWLLWREVKDLDDVSRTAAIGQMSTAHRNGITQLGRILLEVPTDLAKSVFHQAGINMGGYRGGNPFATLGGLYHALKPGDTDRMLAGLEKLGWEGDFIARELFGRSQAETAFVSTTGKPFRGLATTMANTARQGLREKRVIKTILGPMADAYSAYSQIQESYFRRAAMHARFMQRAAAKGLSWEKVVENPALLGLDDVEDALTHSLQVTFAESPTGTVGRGFVNMFKWGQPLTTLAIPYPRYLVNYGKFILDFNPAGALRLFGAGARQERGLDILSRAVVGTMMMGAGYGIRMSDHAGENWYEVKDHRDPRRRINVIGLAGPFLPFLFMGELMKRYINPEMDLKPLTTEDYAQGAIGLRLSPALSAGFEAWRSKDPATHSLGAFAEKAVGEWGGRFTVPLRTFKDFDAAYGNQSEAIYYDPREVLELGKRETTMLNSTIQNVPHLGTALNRPAAVSTVTGQERVGTNTAERQLFGTTVIDRTPVGNELERIGLTDYDVSPRTGIPKADRALSRRIGFLAQKYGPAVLTNDRYQALPRAAQVVVWGELFKEWGKAARDHFAATNPDLADAVKLQGTFTGREKAAIRAYGKDVDAIVKQAVKNANEMEGLPGTPAPVDFGDTQPEAPQPGAPPASNTLSQRPVDAAIELTGIDPALLLSVVEQESHGNPHAVGPKTPYSNGEQAGGLMQILPSTFEGLRPEVERLIGRRAALFDPLSNLVAGSLQYMHNLEQTGGDIAAAARLYHGGPNKRLHGPKTKAYAEQVLRRYEQLQRTGG